MTRPLFAALLGLLGSLFAGCTPSGFVANQFLRAPKSFPKVVSPQPRVYFSFPDQVTDTLPEQLATVGDPPLTLAYRLVPPGDYGARMVLTNHQAYGKSWPLYWFPAHPATNALPPRGTVVFLHGYGLEHGTLIPWALQAAGHGWNGVAVDLRGHGNSDGTRITFGIQEAHDLTDLIDELSRRGQASWPVQVVGVSYGAAVALRWASQESRVERVVAITPYDHLADAIEGLRRSYAAWLPAGLIQRAAEKLPERVGQPPGGLDPLNWLGQHPVTALFIAAGSDPVAPPEAIQRLAACSPSSRIINLEETTHEMAPFRIDQLAQPVLDWLDTPLPQVGQAVSGKR